MFCEKCGQEITGTVKFCPKCGTPVEQAPAVEEAPVAEETPVVEETPVAEAPAEEEKTSLFEDADKPLFEKNEGSIFDETPAEKAAETVAEEAPVEEAAEEIPTFNAAPASEEPAYQYDAPQFATEAPAKKKFNKKILIIVIAAVVVVVAAAVAIFFNFRAAFSSPESLMKNALTGYVKDSYDKNEAYYEKSEDFLKKDGKDGVIEASVTLDDGVRNLLDMTGQDFDWLESAHFRIEVGSDKDDNLGMNMIGGINGTDIASLVYLISAKDDICYMQIPELSDSFFGVDMSSDEFESMQQAMASFTALRESDAVSQKDVEKLLVKYTGIIADQLEDVEKDKDSIEVGDIEAEYYALTATIDQKTASAIAVAVGEEMLKDDDLKELMRVYYGSFAGMDYASISAAMNGYGSYDYYDDAPSDEDFDDVYKEMMDKVEDMVKEQKKQLKMYQKYDEGDTELAELVVYVNMRGDLKGIEVSPNGMDAKAYAYYPEDGKDFGVEVGYSSYGTSGCFTGTGTKSGGVINGEFKVVADDKEYFELEVIDYDEKEYEKNGSLNGEFVIKPGEDLTGGYDMTTQMLASIEYDIVFSGDSDNSKCDFTVKNDEVTFGTISLEVRYEDVDIAEKPDDYYDIENSSDMEAYEKTMDIKELYNRLKDAGVPEQYLSALEYMLK